ncbi:dihydroorotase domain protein [Mycobacterium xenopi 4042]|uniref:Dihydroorotase domain protein n=1 Tax=Mycobacterium xenopi 4042 TaxID=1299334 RepID=X8C230_MYCXE|nr:dihydroorotase domain protein [Mycobacterium xenopi 4042]
MATDHAPHAEHEKCVEFAAARPGMLGLQTALSVVVATMVERACWAGVTSPGDERNPARIAGCRSRPPLEVGERPTSPSSTPTPPGPSPVRTGQPVGNTPYESMTLPATVTATLLRGKVTARDGKCPA